MVAGGKEIVEGREDNTPYIPFDEVSEHQGRLHCQLCISQQPSRALFYIV